MKLSMRVPAKINRELRIGRRRPDGFHEVRSRMVSISLADRLSAETAPDLLFSCDDPAIPGGRENLVVRAAERLAAHAGVPARARITLEKRVPMGGGLGGGSADAAAALRLLATLWGLPADAASLSPIAAELGSDVPFFLWGGQADVTGRGEVVTPVGNAPATELLLLVPPFGVSTAAVYREHAGRFDLASSLDVDRPGRQEFYGPNDLASAVLAVEPRMEAYIESARQFSAEHLISGSGATIALAGPAPGAETALRERHPDARLYRCRTLTREEYQHEAKPTGGPS